MTKHPTGQRGARSSPRSTRQVLLAALVGLAALYPLYAALRFIGSDLAGSGEKFDGLGAAIGAAMLVPLVLAGLAVVLWWRRGRGRHAGWIALGAAALLVGAELWWVGLMGFA